MQTIIQSYTTSALEDWVSDFYLRMKMYKPKQIKIENIARVYDIFIHRKPLPGFYEVVGRYRGISIDNRETAEVQREMFFHELCHLLRHAGVQSMMPAALRELQEHDARNFTRYAAIPFHMLKFIDIEDPFVIDQMVNLFKVTPELCTERLIQIKNRTQHYAISNN